MSTDVLTKPSLFDPLLSVADVMEVLGASRTSVYAWLRGAKPLPAEYDNAVFAGLKAVCGQQSPRWNS